MGLRNSADRFVPKEFTTFSLAQLDSPLKKQSEPLAPAPSFISSKNFASNVHELSVLCLCSACACSAVEALQPAAWDCETRARRGGRGQGRKLVFFRRSNSLVEQRGAPDSCLCLSAADVSLPKTCGSFVRMEPGFRTSPLQNSVLSLHGVGLPLASGRGIARRTSS